MMKRALPLIAAAGVAALTAGCADAPVAHVEPTYQEAALSDFLVTNGNAVARLVDGMDPAQFADGPILVATTVNVNDMNRSSTLGRAVSEQYASKLVTLGFNVKEVKLRGSLYVKEGTGELMLSREVRDIARQHKASMVLVGTYAQAASFVYISQKLVRTEDGRVLRANDYALPIDRDVQRMLQTYNSGVAR
ncbi:MAG: hypothetical protein LBP52_07410 [Burkholderiaceae bacterium]|jgi:TolB-like protein|nr:hypothetical protein [Burkholderiaceae bacterium]